jgi:hypothetical protein
MSTDVAVNMDVNMAVNMNVDMTDDMDADSPCFYGPRSKVAQIFSSY